MLIQVWVALFAAGVLLSIAAFAVRTASLYAALVNVIVWAVLALGSLNIEVVSNGETVVFEQEAVAILCVVQAALSLPVIYLAALGRWDDEAADGLDAATGGMTPETDRR